MSDYRPSFPALYKPAQEAVSELYGYKNNNSLRTAADLMASSSPSSSPVIASSNISGSPSPTMSKSSSEPPTPSPRFANFDSSHLAIPTNAYAAGHHPHSPAFTPPSRPQSPYALPGHMPAIAPRPLPTSPHQLAEAPDCITYDNLIERVQDLLLDNLPDWWIKNHEALHHIAVHLVYRIVHYGKSGTFGPRGLGKLTDVFMSIGHEGTAHYSCLAASSQWGDVTVLLRGNARELEGKHPLQDKEAMGVVRLAFDQAAAELYRSIVDKSGGKPNGFQV